LKKKPSKFTAKDPSSLPSLVEFCHEKNVPFYEKEMRYFDILKGKQNFKEWTDNWKRYCNQNLLEEKKSSHSNMNLLYPTFLHWHSSN
jgi:hypothetical protein